MRSSAIMKDEFGSEGTNMSEELEVRVARIESHVEHIDKVTSDLQVEQRRTNDKLDKLRDDLMTKFDSLKDKINATTIWALLLYFALAGTLLSVMAKGFKWI